MSKAYAVVPILFGRRGKMMYNMLVTLSAQGVIMI